MKKRRKRLEQSPNPKVLLDKQKEQARQIAFSLVGYIILLGALSAVCIMALRDPNAIPSAGSLVRGMFITFFLCTLIFIYIFIDRYRIYKEISKVRFSSEITRTINVFKLGFLNLAASKNTTSLVGIKIQTPEKERFVHIFFKQIPESKGIKARIEQALLGKDIEVKLYRESYHIKEITNFKLEEFIGDNPI